MGVKLKARAYSDIGLYRKKNEDNYLMMKNYLPQEHRITTKKIRANIDKPCLFAVCDGMGGTLYGDTSSFLAVQSLYENFKIVCSLVNKPNRENIKKILDSVNEDICSFSKSKQIELGSTIALLYVDEKEIIVSNIGDSRIYKLYCGKMEQLSKDHNQAYFMYESGMITKEEMKNHRGRHHLTQYLGIKSDEMIIDPYIQCMNHDEGKVIFLICSDGLVETLDDEVIKYILEQKISLKKKSKMLVKSAIKHGSKDNVTALLVEIIKK
ncbi:PP2C family protein-serine/threonine phosphatase [Anaeromicropila herbilytica]|uniref:Serine/threonine protein phosphatase n=1 Tax=Anaeromicropila herbilytica TaxID=2785025 RepID=A0A7R7ICJ2_9FIRM|nr:protein phosphatase 2C domain-containing protein [Anaeromicropila herbilytica]BCN29989.1 serine/threonine protein phosphatase [Anaeromicropila herbilytica]